MYKLSVPFHLDQIRTYGAEPYMQKLKEIGADIAFFALSCYQMDPKKQETVFAVLKENVPIFQKAGFTVLGNRPELEKQTAGCYRVGENGEFLVRCRYVDICTSRYRKDQTNRREICFHIDKNGQQILYNI